MKAKKTVEAWGFLRDDGEIMPDARNSKYIADDEKERNESVVRVVITLAATKRKAKAEGK